MSTTPSRGSWWFCTDICTKSTRRITLSETLLPRWIVLEVICGHRTCGDKLGAGHGKTEGHAEVNRSSQKPARNVLRRSIACLLMQRIKQGAVAYCLGEHHGLVVYSRYRIGLTLMSAGKRKRDVVVGGRWGVKTGWFYTDSVLTGNGMVSEYPGFRPFYPTRVLCSLGNYGVWFGRVCKWRSVL